MFAFRERGCPETDCACTDRLLPNDDCERSWRCLVPGPTLAEKLLFWPYREVVDEVEL